MKKPDKLICEDCTECRGTENILMPNNTIYTRCKMSGLMWRAVWTKEDIEQAKKDGEELYKKIGWT
jgi:hypothetical protein